MAITSKHLGVTVPTEVLDRLDKFIARETKRTGYRVTKSNLVAVALSEYMDHMDALDKPAEVC